MLASPPTTKSHSGPYFAFDRLGAPTWTPRDPAAFAREGFMQNAVVYRAVRMIAEAAASVPLLLYAGDEEIAEHPLLSLLARPNAQSSTPDLLEAWYGFLLVAGNAYLEAIAIGGEPRELHILRPDRMRIVAGPGGWPEAYDYTVDGKTRRIAGEAAPGVPRILHLKLFHPLNDHYGLSPIEAAASAIDIHNTASRWNKALLDNSARPSGALVYTARDGNLTTEQYDRLKSELEHGFQGAARAGRPLLLEGGLDWKSMSLSPKDMDFIEAKHVAAREIALALGVPPMLLGIPGDNTYANYQEANRTFWRQTVLPLVNRTAKALSAWLAPAYSGVRPVLPEAGTENGSDTISPSLLSADAPSLTLRPDLDAIEALSAEREALWTRLDKATFLTPNEKRSAVGYGPLNGGDDIKGSDPSCRRQALSKGLGPLDNPAQKFNPYHDELGQFTNAEGATQGGGLVHTVNRRRGRPGGGTPAQETRRAAAELSARIAERRVRKLDPDWRRPDSVQAPDSIEGDIARFEGITQAAETHLAEVLPRGFGTYENYVVFGQSLRDGLRAAGYRDVEPMIRGSAVTGESFRTGESFDVGRRSDYDIALASPSLMQRSIELGIPLREGGTRTRPLRNSDLDRLGLRDLRDGLESEAGRKVSFMIYSSTQSVVRRGLSRPILGK